MSSPYQDLRVWKLAMQLAGEIYKSTERFPEREKYGLISQLRRAAVSVASNIAEGKGHRSDREFLHFLYHARGSLFEVETQLLLAKQLHYALEKETSEIQQTITATARSLTGLINALEEKPRTATRNRPPLP